MDTETHMPGEDEGRDQEGQRLSVNHQKPGEGPGTDSPSRPLEGTNPADTLISDFQAPELWDHKFLLCKLLSLWYFVMVALENEYSQ